MSLEEAPQFTLITSTLDSAAVLERCLRSVEGQRDAAFEHLIADGASSDDTLAIVEHYSRCYPLRLACSEPDSGLYQAWNRGIDQTRGQWILFLGSDDFLIASDILHRVARAIEATPSLLAQAFLYGDTCGAAGSPDWSRHRPRHWADRLRGITYYPTSVLINARLFRSGHRFDESYRICADHKFFAQHDLFGQGTYLPFPMISFQQGGISSSPNFERLHYSERRRLLHELNCPRPWFSEWYYWLRAHQRRAAPS